MCLDPVTAGAMAIGAVGSAIKGNEEAKNQRRMTQARNAATQAEIARQHGYQAETGKLFDDTMLGFTPTAQAGALTGAQDRLGGVLAGNAPTAAMLGSINSGNVPAAAARSEASKVADVFDRAGARDSALGTLGGWQDRLFNNSLAIGDAGRKVDTVGNFARVSSGLTAGEQDAAANNAYRPPSGIGDILSTAGNVLGFMGGSGSSLFNPLKLTSVGAPMDIRPLIQRVG